MTLTPEQFNKLATKDDLQELKREMVSKSEFATMMKTVDGIAKGVKDIKDDQATNLAAHDRIQEDVNEVREHVGLKVKHTVLKPERT